MSGQVIRLICPNLTCRTILSVPAGARGKDVRCRACGAKVRIPMPKAPKPGVAEEPAAQPQSTSDNTPPAKA